MNKWNKYCNKCAVLAVAVIVAWGAFGATLEGVVTRVSDGDTIWVTTKDGPREKVRMDRIDAPESNQEYGKEATDYLARRVKGKTVSVEWQKRDQYGRILGIVRLDGADINLEMVATGNAWHYSHFDKTEAYAEAEESARAARLGLWAAESPVNPYEFRRSQRTIGSDIIAVTIIDGKRVMVDPQTLKPLDAVPIAHPEPKD